jgi:transposase InsO family protein
MSLRIEFVERAAKPGSNVSALCREFGISRETGHKWLARIREQGYDGLEERSRRPATSPYATAEEVVLAVLSEREAHPAWGPKKLEVVLRRRLRDDTPSRATIARILQRFGSVRRRRRKAPVSVLERAPDVVAKSCNEVWTIDFKGWWLAGDGARCEPLTVRDAHSRFILAATLLESANGLAVRSECERLFRRYGVPDAIQCDNGSPFINVQGRAGLTRLSAWWVSLGIALVRSRPGCPQDNGAHERMHRDMKSDVAAFPQTTRRAEQKALDRWRQEFNHVRPHEALGGKTPAELYRPGTRRSLRPVAWRYPEGWMTKRACAPNGCISLHGQDVHVGRAFIGQTLGVEPRSDRVACLWLNDVELGCVRIAPPTTVIDKVCMQYLHSRKKGGKKAA